MKLVLTRHPHVFIDVESVNSFDSIIGEEPVVVRRFNVHLPNAPPGLSGDGLYDKFD
jgi:hypothetical protein